MKYFLAIIGSVTILSLACNTAGPVPATPAGGGAQPTATGAPSAGGGGNVGGGGAPSAETGRALVSSKGCIACHTITGLQGATGTVGPNLTTVGDAAKYPKIGGGTLDNNTDNMKRWLANPPAVKPGTVMPNLGLSPAEIDSLVLYLATLK